MDEIVIPKFYLNGHTKPIALILAGGFGTRLKRLTEDLPKPLMDINGKPILEHLILQLKKYGIEKIIISVGYLAKTIIDYFGGGEKWGIDITYSLETEPLGTGGAVKIISDRLVNDFLVLWGDNLCDIDIDALLKRHKGSKSHLTMVLVERYDTENFGVAVIKDKYIIGFVEKPRREEAPSNLINAGIFMISPRLLYNLPSRGSIERELFEKIVKTEKISYYLHKGEWLPTDTPEKLEVARLKWSINEPH